MKKCNRIVYLIIVLVLITGCSDKNILQSKTTEQATTDSITDNNVNGDGYVDDLVDDYMNNTNSSDTNSTNNVEKENVTAERFMEIYNLTENDIPKEYVQSYIDEYDLKEEELRGVEKTMVLIAYERGTVYGYNIAEIFRGDRSDEPLADYMKQAEVIMFRFGMHNGTELIYEEIMVIDLKEGYIYYTNGYIQAYTKSELSAKLSDEDLEAIRKELPTHIEEGKGVGDFGGFADYSFRIEMVATDGTGKYYMGDEGDEEHFPEFDDYWKGLYKKYFGKEYKFEPRD